MSTNMLDNIIDHRIDQMDRQLAAKDSHYCRFELATVAKEYSTNMQLYILEQFINGGLQVRRGNEKNTMLWWYADGSNAEGDDLESLLSEIESRVNAKE